MQPLPESPATLQEQQRQLLAGDRRVQMFPGGVGELAVPEGMRRIKVPKGDVFHFDPSRVKASEIVKASRDGRENELLDLGPMDKAQAMQRAAQGEQPVAVVERTPEGVEARAAASTEKTARNQAKVMKRAKSPRNKVSIEHPADVLRRRFAEGGKVQELSEYHPTWRERLAQTMLGDSYGAAKENFVKGLMGTTGLGTSGIGLVDVTPAGVPMAVQEAYRSGDPQGMALAAMPGGGSMARGARRNLITVYRGGTTPWFADEWDTVYRPELFAHTDRNIAAQYGGVSEFKVDRSSLFDATKDSQKWREFINTGDPLNAVRKAGYKGAIYPDDHDWEIPVNGLELAIFDPSAAILPGELKKKKMKNRRLEDVFDDKLIDILRKYGFLAPVAGGATLADAEAAPSLTDGPQMANGGGVDDWLVPDQDDWTQPDPPMSGPTLRAANDMPAPDVGAFNAFATGAEQGLTANFGDELRGVRAASGIPQPAQNVMAGAGAIGTLSPYVMGLARLGYEYLTGGEQAAGRYSQARDEFRELSRQAQEQHPIAYGTGNVAGAVAVPGGAVLKAPTLAGRVARGTGLGTVMGGMYGAGEGETAEDRLSRAGTGALIGGATGMVAPPLIEGVGKVASAVASPITTAYRGLRDPEGEAARRILESIKRDRRGGYGGLTTQEYLAAHREGSPVALIDLGGTRTRAVARSAANTSPEARGSLETMLHTRAKEQNLRAAEEVRALIPTHANATLTRDALENAARTSRKPFYDRAYRDGAGGIWDDDLAQLSQAPSVQAAVKSAIRQAEDRTVSGRAGPMLSPDEKPTLEFWDLVQRQLRQEIDVAKRAGKKEDAMELGDLRNAIMAKLDAAVPTYPVARGVAAELFKANSALEAGEKFVESSLKNQEVKKALAKMSPEERALFAEGFASRYIERINEIADRRDVVKLLQRSPAERERIEMVLGPHGAHKLAAFLHREQIMEMAKSAVSGNSTTIRQLMEAGLAGGAMGALSGQNPFTDPASIVTALMTFGARRGQMRIDQNVAQRVGEMLASSDPRVLQRGLNMVAQSPKLSRALSEAAVRLGAAESPKTGVLPAIQGTVAGRAEDENQD